MSCFYETRLTFLVYNRRPILQNFHSVFQQKSVKDRPSCITDLASNDLSSLINTEYQTKVIKGYKKELLPPKWLVTLYFLVYITKYVFKLLHRLHRILSISCNNWKSRLRMITALLCRRAVVSFIKISVPRYIIQRLSSMAVAV